RNVSGRMQYQDNHDNDSLNNLLYERRSDSTEYLLQPRTRSWLWRCWSAIASFWYSLTTRHHVAKGSTLIHPTQASKKSWVQDQTISYRWYRSPMANGSRGYAGQIQIE